MAARPKILVVEDSRAQLDRAVDVLSREGYQVSTAGDGKEAIRKAKTEPPDLVLLDMILPDMDGLEVLRIIKAQAPAFVPVILLSVKSDLDSRVAGLRIGADDFLAKPFAEAEVLARAAAMLRIKTLQDQLRDANSQLEKLSIEDGLTKLFNHRHFQEELRREFGRAQRYSDPLSLVMIDLDHFKAVNDRHGHPFGDLVLRETAQLVRSRLRDTDLCARYGGEEFALILPKTMMAGALAVAERIHRELNQKVFRLDVPPSAGPGGAVPEGSKGINQERVTASFGIASYPSKDITSAELLIRYADEALYRAKREGRNAICVFQSQAQSYRYDVGAARR
jgi:two-component system, cell cycle response regulator